MEKQFNFKIKSFNSNWGGKFRPLFKHFQQTGIQHRITYPHTHVQNGTAERKFWHIVDIGLELLGQSHVPFKFWHFAFETTVFFINRMP